MRVVLLDFALDEKGLRTLELARMLAAQPGVIAVLACPRAGRSCPAAVAVPEVAVVPLRGGYGHLLWLFKILPELRKPGTLLLAHGLTAARAAMWCARLVRDLPVVVMGRGLWPLKALSLATRRQLRLACAKALRVLVPTAELGEAFVGHGCVSEKIRVCPWGLPSESAEFGQSHSVFQDSRLVFLAADSLVPESGLSDLVDAMALVLGMEGLPPWEVRIVGEGPDFAELLDKAKNLGTEARLALLGAQGLTDQLALAHVAVCAARESREQRDFVLRAWAQGRVLIATATPELRDMLADKENALVAPPRNAVVLAAAMVRCLKEPELRERLREAGREAVTLHTPEICTARVLAACNDVLAEVRQLQKTRHPLVQEAPAPKKSD